jgi:hypothetical protein
MSSVSMRVDVGGSDGIPHTFLVVTHPDGRVVEYGFAPQVTGLSGPGQIFISGDGTADGPHEYGYQGPIQPLSDSQYQRMMENINRSIANPPYYVVTGTWTPGTGTNCTSWAIDVWRDVGLPNVFGVTNSSNWNPYGQAMNIFIADIVNSLITAALNWVAPRRDPLVLDLDGSGITTSAINPAAPILFDHDGDGTKTASGWIASGEAIVVRDLNGNNLIDNGRELFGDNTILTRGARAGQVAANGFEALADLDMDINGVADGKFDAADTAFASVKLWRDQNQNGISETGELFTFADLGVASINTTGTADNVNLGGDNTQTHAGTFTRTTGATGEAGTAHLAASLLLANNNFYREFSDDPALSAEAQALPQMQGSGTVRDLRPAMSLGTPQAAALQAALTQFAADTTRDAQLGSLDALVQSWGATSAMPTSVQTNRVIANYGGPNVINTYGATAIERYALDNPALYAKITALEQSKADDDTQACKSSATVTPRASAIFSTLSSEMFRTCRSTWAMKVRCRSASNAKSSCDHSRSCRNLTMLTANMSRAQRRLRADFAGGLADVRGIGL